jgi:hypothetical protein
MNRKSDISKRFPGYYDHYALDEKRKELGLSLRKVAAKMNMNLNTTRRVFKGRAHQKQAYPIAVDLFKMSWSELHVLNPPSNGTHRAARAVR